MTERITEVKLNRVADVIEQLNEELHPLVVKAVLIDSEMTKSPLTTQTHLNVLRDVLRAIQELISLVIE